MKFSDKFRYLQNEAFLTYGTLSTGLTALRNAAHPDKPTFYSGFFNTAVALERLMKLIVITDHMIQHAYVVPSRADLKDYGHDLRTLHASCVTIAARNSVDGVKALQPGSIEQDVLEFFSDFATHARYFNLDALSSGAPSYEDPLARWERVLAKALQADVPMKKLEQLRTRARAISSAIADVTKVIQHGMRGQLLSLEEVLADSEAHSLAAQHAMVRVFNILAPLLNLVGELGHAGFYGSPRHEGPHVPVYSEFFVLFSGTPAEIRKKKRWP